MNLAMAVLLARVTADPTVMDGVEDREADVPLWVERKVEAEDVADDERGNELEDEREDVPTDELDGKRDEKLVDGLDEDPEFEGASWDSDVATKPASITKSIIVKATNLLNIDELKSMRRRHGEHDYSKLTAALIKTKEWGQMQMVGIWIGKHITAFGEMTGKKERKKGKKVLASSFALEKRRILSMISPRIDL